MSKMMILIPMLLMVGVFVGSGIYMIVRSMNEDLLKCPGSTSNKCSTLISGKCCSSSSLLVSCNSMECACVTQSFQITPVCEAMIPTTEGDRIWMKVGGSLLLVVAVAAIAISARMAIRLSAIRSYGMGSTAAPLPAETAYHRQPLVTENSGACVNATPIDGNDGVPAPQGASNPYSQVTAAS